MGVTKNLKETLGAKLKAPGPETAEGKDSAKDLFEQILDRLSDFIAPTELATSSGFHVQGFVGFERYAPFTTTQTTVLVQVWPRNLENPDPENVRPIARVYWSMDPIIVEDPEDSELLPQAAEDEVRLLEIRNDFSTQLSALYIDTSGKAHQQQMRHTSGIDYAQELIAELEVS